MSEGTEKIHQTQHPAQSPKSWIPAIVFLMLAVLIVQAVSPVFSSSGQGLSSGSASANLTPTFRTSPIYSTATPLPSTKTPTPTLTSTPMDLTPLGVATLSVVRNNINLQKGPGSQYPVAGQLMSGDVLTVMGRTKDGVWLYVETKDKKVGWVKISYVNASEIKVNRQPIKTPEPPPNAKVKITADLIHLRAGPGTHFSVIERLSWGDTLELLGKLDDNSWLYLKTADGKTGWLSAKWVHLQGLNLEIDYVPIATSPPTETSTPVILTDIPGRWIDIDLSEQRLYAYEGTKRVGSFSVSTGTEKYPTEQGRFKIYVKYRYDDMQGSGYFLPDVPFTMYYSGAFAIHGTYWHHNFGTRMSRGCVNMETSEAEWLYNWADIGTVVNVHR